MRDPDIDLRRAGGPADPPILLRRSSRARRITLRVSALDGRVTLTLPRGMAEREALAFAADRMGWIRAQLRRMAPPVDAAPGRTLPVDGRPHEIVRGPRAELGPGRIVVRDAAPVGPQAARCLQALARDRLTDAALRHAARVERRVGRITLRDTRSRWGSCSARGDLMFSWRLILAPPDVLEYVAAHEVAHLVRMDHSAAFWAVVARLVPDHAQHRAWLRQHGAELHAWRFDA